MKKVLSNELIEASQDVYHRIITMLNEKERYKYEDYVILNLVKNYLEKIKTIKILSELEREESITILTRAAFEVYVSLIHIIDGDTEKLAKSYHYNQKVQQLRAVKKSTKKVELTEDELKKIKKINPSVNSFDSYLKYYEDKWYDLFDSKPSNKKEYQRKWYSFDWKLNSFISLTKYVGIDRYYSNFYYGMTSIDTHAMSGLGTIKDDSDVMEWGSISPEMCYVLLDQNLCNLIYKISERYNLLEIEKIKTNLQIMAKVSISLF